MESFTIAVNYYLHSTPPQTFMSVLGTPVKSLTGEWGKFNGNVYKKSFYQIPISPVYFCALFIYLFIRLYIYLC